MQGMRFFCIEEFGQPLVGADKPVPVPAGTEVVLKVKAAGVCHSDIHLWEGGYDLGLGRKLSLRDRGVALPITMGHETVGEVVALGPDATGVAIGERHLAYPWIGCRECQTCRDGFENYCAKAGYLGVHRDGGYAEYLRVPDARYLLPIGDLDPAEIAPLACSGVTTYSALKKLGDQIKRQPVVIIGAGGLGLMALQVLRALGGIGAVMVDLDPAKRQTALDAGALAAIDGAAPDALAAIAAAVGGPAQSVLDLVGNDKSTALGFDALAKGGTLVIVGLFGGVAPWSLALIPMKAARIQGSLVGNLQELRELVDLARAGKIAPIPVTRLPLASANDALIGLREGRFVGRAVLCP
jgi:propanol-preferring alcohol dehydrogenase